MSLALLTMLALIVAGYPLAAWIGSSVPQNAGWREPAEGVEIMVSTNGTHTGIVMPVVTPIKDWRETFPSTAKPTAAGRMPTHIDIGYGEREVFMEVPTWSDLSPAIALRIATLGGDALIRVSHYVHPAPRENYRPLTLTDKQYARLVASIETHLPRSHPAHRKTLRGTFPDDAYYEATGRYTLGNTCNTWVGARLADAGVPMGLWTPLAGGVMKWVPVPENRSPELAPD